MAVKEFMYVEGITGDYQMWHDISDFSILEDKVYDHEIWSYPPIFFELIKRSDVMIHSFPLEIDKDNKDISDINKEISDITYLQNLPEIRRKTIKGAFRWITVQKHYPSAEKTMSYRMNEVTTLRVWPVREVVARGNMKRGPLVELTGRRMRFACRHWEFRQSSEGPAALGGPDFDKI